MGVSSKERLHQIKKIIDIPKVVILTTARSGSTYLAFQLYLTKAVGPPDEHFSFHYYKAVLERYRKPHVDDLLFSMEKAIHNNVFSATYLGDWFRAWIAETNRLLNPYIDKPFHTLFINPKTIWIYLKRQDILGQAISYYFMLKTGISHHIKSNNHPFIVSSPTPHFAKYYNYGVPFQFLEIKNILNGFIQQYKEIEDFFNTYHIQPYSLEFPNIIGNTDHLKTILRRLHKDPLTLPSKMDIPFEKSSNHINKITKELYLYVDDKINKFPNPPDPNFVYELSLEALDKIVKKHDEWYYFQKAFFLNKLNSLKKAEQYFEKSIEINPTITGFYQYYSLLLTQRGNHEKALKTLIDAFIHKNFKRFYILIDHIALLLYHMNKKKQAISLVKRVALFGSKQFKTIKDQYRDLYDYLLEKQIKLNFIRLDIANRWYHFCKGTSGNLESMISQHIEIFKGNDLSYLWMAKYQFDHKNYIKGLSFLIQAIENNLEYLEATKDWFFSNQLIDDFTRYLHWKALRLANTILSDPSLYPFLHDNSFNTIANAFFHLYDRYKIQNPHILHDINILYNLIGHFYYSSKKIPEALRFYQKAFSVYKNPSFRLLLLSFRKRKILKLIPLSLYYLKYRLRNNSPPFPFDFDYF